MGPKKKSAADFIIPIIVSLIVLYFALHLAMSYDMVSALSEKFDIMAFFDDFSTRLTEKPLEIKWVESSPKFLLVAVVACVLGIAYTATTKKNYINNKEYGSSEWGTPQQIAHLLAKNIKKDRIKEIKKSKGFKGREKSKEVEAAKKKYEDSSNVIFTQTEKICMYNFELNNNTLIIGGSGSGKTRGYVLPNILQCCDSPYSPSLVITDPKGEIISKIGGYLKDQGYVLKVLNLKEQERSFCFNPFAYVMPDKFEEQISTIVSSIMDSRDDKKDSKSSDPFWEDMAKVLLSAIFYATYEGCEKEERNMSTVMSLFRWFEVSDEDDRYENPTRLDSFFETFGDKDGTVPVAKAIDNFYKAYYGQYYKAVGIDASLSQDYKEIKANVAIPIYASNGTVIRQYEKEIQQISEALREKSLLDGQIKKRSEDALDQIQRYLENRANNYANEERPVGVALYEKYGDGDSNPALRCWEDFRTKCKGKTAQSVTATALAKLAPFDEAQIRRIFSRDEMELDLVGERRTALFIVLPPLRKRYNFIANVLYNMLFEQLEYCATVKHNQSLPVPVRFIMDEFYNTGKVNDFENILSYARSFGIGISIILQSLDQIKEMYEKSWGTILDNCSTFLYLGGIRHADTLEYISKLLGKGTFDKKTYSVTKGRQSSSSTSYDKIGRELLDASEIQRLSKNKCLLFVSGYQPFMSRKFNYKTHKNYKFTADANKKNLYQYEIPKAPVQEALEPIEQQIDIATPIVTVEVAKEEKQEVVTTPKRVRRQPIVMNLEAEKLVGFMNDNMLGLEIINTEDEEFFGEIFETEKQDMENLKDIIKTTSTIGA